MLNDDDAIVFNINVVNMNNITIMMAFRQKVSASRVKEFAASFGDLLKASRHIAGKLASVELATDTTCAVRDKEEGVIVEMSGLQVNFPWHAAAVVFSLQVAYWDILGKRPSSRIYIDTLLSPSEVEDWKTRIHKVFFNDQ